MNKNLSFLTLFILFISISCSPKVSQTGKASYYHDKFHGRTTANGEKYKKHKMTAAHKTLPFGTKVKVINQTNGKRVRVRINDRGPFVSGRIIDLSKKAAKKIDLLDAGETDVKIKYKK
ncbi:septal ring lytic transglycosylase RlpA family protein [Belliella kenyensis]|uniref:Probable endolytic peptidoglycan transglycosylase RlpA n=1 Tax=Belliella kenyensis TaxID=1472724 RepID=A0ABV8EJT6_9BACT|nr:septal ring lytic transglycosylase RlpA family protein [Belliella kenyensis]MCH7400271.1 septal ring lytic transglycosylase RlpA family protein [Belliella kenyensis]MDN3604711.1 septal ring lytic transglycosylase RlpA family protein [Belliella kenyensis]